MADSRDELCKEMRKAIWDYPRSSVDAKFDEVKAAGDALKEEVDLLNTGIQTLTSKAAHLTATSKAELKELEDKYHEVLAESKEAQM